MDEPLREALGMERQPRWLVARGRPRAAAAGQGAAVLPAPHARRTSGTHPTYPNGYEPSRIGPASMLDELNDDTSKEPHVA